MHWWNTNFMLFRIPKSQKDNEVNGKNKYAVNPAERRSDATTATYTSS